jgi:Trypsin-like peptidase domain/PEGA domain
MGNSKNNFSIAGSNPAAARRIVFRILVLVFAAGAPACHSQSQEDKLALQLRQNVVAISVGNRSGFGFITGERNGLLYIATARHVLNSSDDPDGTTAPKVKVTFFSDQGRTYSADVLGTHDAQHDLAVLTVASPAGFSWIKECQSGADSAKRGTQVWFVGKNGTWFVPVQPGAIASEAPSSHGMLEIDGLQVRVGSSGGPLIAGTGIVGMIQNDSEDDTRALTIDIVRDAFREWNYPWDLRETNSGGAGGTSSAPQQSCTVSIESDPADASITLDGVARGETPADLELVRGKTYSLVVEKEGSVAVKQKIDCESKKVLANLKRATADITIRYIGDSMSCVLGLEITIGDKSFRPTANLFIARDIPLGNQEFSIVGQIRCPTGGACEAVGSGTIDVRDGATYDVAWRNTTYGHCYVGLLGH